MRGDGADALLWLAQQAQPQHRVLDQVIAAKIAVMNEAIGGQRLGGVGELDPGGVGQIGLLNRDEARPQWLADPEQHQRNSEH